MGQRTGPPAQSRARSPQAASGSRPSPASPAHRWQATERYKAEGRAAPAAGPAALTDAEGVVPGLAATLLFACAIAARRGSLSPLATGAMLSLALLAILGAVLHIGSRP